MKKITTLLLAMVFVFLWGGIGFAQVGTGIGETYTTYKQRTSAPSTPASTYDRLYFYTGDVMKFVTSSGSSKSVITDSDTASTTVAGVTMYCTDGITTTPGTSTTCATNPANLTAKMASPGAIGATTPAAGTFTTLTTTGKVTLPNGTAASPAIVGADADSGIAFAAGGTKSLDYVYDGAVKWGFTNTELVGFAPSTIRADGILSLYGATNYSLLLGNATPGTGYIRLRDTFALESVTTNTGGGIRRKVAEAAANITASASVTIAVNVPSGARILGCQLRVDTALTATELWDAAYAGGATQAIATAQAVAKSTKVNTMFNTNAATDITSDVTTIAITKNGGGSFTAAGTIRAVVYYEDFVSLSDAP